MSENVYIAVDLGAGSGRVFLCDLGDRFRLDEVHRFTYPPRVADGRLRWDFGLIFAEVKAGLAAAAARARKDGKTVRSIGVDSWAVDYGLLNGEGELLADPVCYRDARTNGMMDRVFAGNIGRDELFARTGIQFLPFNTIFQFAADERLGEAATALLLPDLINFFLTGEKACEYTNATTMQLVDARTGEFDRQLLARLGISPDVLAPIAAPGSVLGKLAAGIAAETGLENVDVVLPATHDTGSAVAGAPLDADQAYISSGTWSLVGVELAAPLIDDEVARYNFTNEGGVYGTIRFLKNVMGLWIFESCRREWAAQGVETDYATLLDGVARIDGFRGFIFPDDERFLNPPSMLDAIASQLVESDQDVPLDPVRIAKIVLDSLAFRYASVLRTIEKLTGRPNSGLQIVGGGGRNRYLNQATADASGLIVSAGLVEATVTGNALVQAIADGRFADHAEARAFVRANVALETFAPRASEEICRAAEAFAAVEKRFLK